MNNFIPWKLTSDALQSMLIISALFNTFSCAVNMKSPIIALKSVPSDRFDCLLVH